MISHRDHSRRSRNVNREHVRRGDPGSTRDHPLTDYVSRRRLYAVENSDVVTRQRPCDVAYSIDGPFHHRIHPTETLREGRNLTRVAVPLCQCLSSQGL